MTTDVLKTSERILDMYEENGGFISPDALTRACIEAGVWSEEENAKALFRARRRQVTRALQTPRDANGLRVHGPTTKKDAGGAQVWAQRSLWDADDYALNIRQHVHYWHANEHSARLLQKECFVRHKVLVPFDGEAQADAA